MKLVTTKSTKLILGLNIVQAICLTVSALAAGLKAINERSLTVANDSEAYITGVALGVVLFVLWAWLSFHAYGKLVKLREQAEQFGGLNR